MRRFSAGEDGGIPDPSYPSYDPYAQPYAQTEEGIPYYLEKPVEEEQPFIGPEYRPEELLGPSKPLPAWVIPVVVGAGAFVLLGGMGLLLGKRRKRRMGRR